MPFDLHDTIAWDDAPENDRLREVRALLDYFAAMAVLFQDEGSTLERLGIRITTN